MRLFIEKTNRFLETPLDLAPRILLLVAGLLVLPCYLFPLYDMTMFAPQYSDGLRLHIYSYKLEGGNGGQDIKEINVLNHYIGMKDLVAEDFTEFKWMPFVIGALGLLLLRTAVMGRFGTLVDMSVVFGYFGAFSLWSFGYKLYHYGHDLAPTAAVKVDPFMPPLFGHKKLANFDVYSYPAGASYALLAVGLALAGALYLAWREGRSDLAAEARTGG